MTLGHVRDNFLRVLLTLPGSAGPVPVEFLVDTGFDGELSLPIFILQHLDAAFSIDQEIMLADGSRGQRPLYRISMDGTSPCGQQTSCCWKEHRFWASTSLPDRFCRRK